MSSRSWIGICALALSLLADAGPTFAQGGAAGAIGAMQPPTPDQATVVVVVTGLRSTRGFVSGGLYRDSSRWTQRGGEVYTCSVRPTSDTVRCVMRGVQPGRYAFAFMHDEDGDGEIDRNALGIPDEGYGFSNDVRPVLSAPSFDSASFDVAPGTVRIRVTTRYGI